MLRQIMHLIFLFLFFLIWFNNQLQHIRACFNFQETLMFMFYFVVVSFLFVVLTISLKQKRTTHTHTLCIVSRMLVREYVPMCHVQLISNIHGCIYLLLCFFFYYSLVKEEMHNQLVLVFTVFLLSSSVFIYPFYYYCTFLFLYTSICSLIVYAAHF